MATGTLITYTLGAQHDNQLGAGGLPCDGTVTVGPADAVCYADVTYDVNGVQYEQTIMNVPFQDATRLPLYITYFINNQASQLGD